MVRSSIQPSSRSRWTKAAVHWLMAEAVPAPKNPMVGGFADCCARAASGHAAAAPPSSVMNSRLLVCRERSIVRGDEDRIMIRPSSRPEARSLLGCQTASELGAPVASSTPEQLPGHEPASARMGYEDGHTLFLRCRRVEGPLGRGGLPEGWFFSVSNDIAGWAELV